MPNHPRPPRVTQRELPNTIIAGTALSPSRKVAPSLPHRSNLRTLLNRTRPRKSQPRNSPLAKSNNLLVATPISGFKISSPRKKKPILTPTPQTCRPTFPLCDPAVRDLLVHLLHLRSRVLRLAVLANVMLSSAMAHVYDSTVVGEGAATRTRMRAVIAHLKRERRSIRHGFVRRGDKVSW